VMNIEEESFSNGTSGVQVMAAMCNISYLLHFSNLPFELEEAMDSHPGLLE
jgi:hypothetical protein